MEGDTLTSVPAGTHRFLKMGRATRDQLRKPSCSPRRKATTMELGTLHARDASGTHFGVVPELLSYALTQHALRNLERSLSSGSLRTRTKQQ